MRLAACAVVDAYRDQPRLAGARGAQYVEPGTVAVIDLEPEPRGVLNHFGIVVDGGDVDILGQQTLRHDLAEAAEADHQHGSARLGEVIGLTGVRRVKAAEQRFGERGDQRTQEHGDRGNGRQDAGLAGVQHAERRRRAE